MLEPVTIENKCITGFDLFGIPIKRGIPAIDVNPPVPILKVPRVSRYLEKKRREPAIAQMVNFRPSYTTVYAERQDMPVKSQKFMDNTVNLQRVGASQAGAKSISDKAKNNIRAAVDWLLAASQEKEVLRTMDNTRFKFRVNFVTLTLSAKQMHSDQKIKSDVLAPFLNILRKRYALKNYIWKAEPQRNGNIHFHLVTDIFIHMTSIRDLWNDCQNNLGYINAFESVHGHRNPNSTDVHSVRKVKKLAAYLSKYLTKESPIRKITGRQWFLSETLQGMKSIKMYASDIDDEFRAVYNNVHQSLKKSFDYCTVLLVDIGTFMKNKSGKISSAVKKFLEPLQMPQSFELNIV